MLVESGEVELQEAQGTGSKKLQHDQAKAEDVKSDREGVRNKEKRLISR